jgi:hypothetical protein
VGTAVISQFLNTVCRKFKENNYWVHYRMSSDKKTLEDRRLDRLEFGKPLGDNLRKAKEYYVKFADSTKSDVQIRINRIKKVLEKEGLPVPEAHTEVASVTAPVSSLSPPTVVAEEIAEPAPQLTVGSTPSVLSSQSAVFADSSLKAPIVDESEVASAAVGSTSSSSSAGPFHIPDLGNAGAASMSSSSSASSYYGDVSESKSGELESYYLNEHTREHLGAELGPLGVKSLNAFSVANGHSTSSLAVASPEEHSSVEITDEDPMKELDAKIKACKLECEALTMEKKAIQEFRLHEEIKGISLKKTSKLIDLLRDRILDPSSQWKANLQTLIDIPHSLTGKQHLRGGDYFEAFFQIAIATSILPYFKDKYVNFYDIHDYKHMRIFKNYLYEKSVQNSGGGEHGISDITFVCSNTPDPEVPPSSSYKCGMPVVEETITKNPIYFISVKGYKKEKSPTKDYDVPLLNLQLSIFPEIKEKRVMVCVRNKQAFLDKLGRSSDLLKHVLERHHVIGFDDLLTAFTDFRMRCLSKLEHNPSIESRGALLRQLFPEKEIHKPMLSMYFHQELVSNSVMRRIGENADNHSAPHYLCIGVLPRGGKSYIAGGIINQHKQWKQARAQFALSSSSSSSSSSSTITAKGYNVLFLTSAVNETREQFRSDLIKKFSDFADFSFIDLVDQKPEKEQLNNFYFISRQLSTMPKEEDTAEGKESSLIAEVSILDQLTRKLGRLPAFDICFFDEAHIGITAVSVRSNFDKTFAAFPGIPIILMTATYKRPSAVLRSNDDLFVWDLQDIKDMKSLPTLGLDKFVSTKPDILVRYPDAGKLLAKRVSYGESLETLAKPYLQFANPNFISLTFAPNEVRQMVEIGAGYDYMSPFELNQDPVLLKDSSRWKDWWSLLRNKEHVKPLLEFLTPEREGDDEVLVGTNRKYRALNQIFRIAQEHGSRPMQGRPFSILMFLPFRSADKMSGKTSIRIGELCRVWASLMLSKRYWRENFVFLTLSVYSGHSPTKLTIEKDVARGLVHRDDYKMDLKDLIKTVEREALKQEKGLVILSGDVAKMGISLPCVDVVFMMGNNPDADDIIQKMYRALTDDPPMKKDGFIVDLNLKRIVTAMFDYDLEKDRLRTSMIKLPSVEERAIRLFNLCDWGQNGYMEDNSSKTFDDIMAEIKKRIVNELREKVMKEHEIGVIKKAQVELLKQSPGLLKIVKDALQGSPKGKGGKGTKSEILMAKGTEIPSSSAASSAAGEDEPDEANGPAGVSEETSVATLTDEELGKLWFNIAHTFVNTLVVKSSESLSDESMNLVALLKKYRKDKSELSRDPECECINTATSSSKNCLAHHNNLYEIVYCELRAFAQGKDGLDVTRMKRIMDMIDATFALPAVEWNIYIEGFLRELRGQVAKRARRFTRRNKRSCMNRR